MRYLLLLLIFISLSSLGQTTPSQNGIRCDAFPSVGNAQFTAYGTDSTDVANAACGAFGADYVGNRTCDDPSTSGSDGQVLCGVIKVCLTGNGYEAADGAGFCPDPDDDDDDGNNCDEGEEGTADCQCDDGSTATTTQACPEDNDEDRDGDGEPDSEDDDDGVCDEQNQGDGDCNGECDAQDEQGSEDCGDDSCQVGESIGGSSTGSLFQPFDVSVFPYSPPETVCSRNGCLYNLGPCVSQVGNPNIVGCEGTGTGQSCSSCTEPSCVNSDCPPGETLNPDTSICEDIDNFCDQDLDNDGIPDNVDSFACQDNDCDQDPEADGCFQPDDVITYACQDQPPVCPSDASAVDCAILQQNYTLRCSAEITQDLDCEIDFECNLADPSLCAIAHTNYLSLCRYSLTKEEIDAIDRLLDPDSQLSKDVDSGAYYYGDKQSEGSTIELNKITFDRNTFSVNSTADTDFSTQTQFGLVVVDVSESLSLWDALGALVILSSLIYAVRLVGRAHAS